MVRMLLLLLILVVPASQAQTLRVGTKEAPPFAMKGQDGRWYGLSIDLWQAVADSLDLSYEFVEVDLPALTQGLREGSLDVSVAALTITAEREAVVDFTHPFYVAGLGIAATVRYESGWWALIRAMLSLRFLQVVAALAGLLLAVGTLVWFFERRRNPEQFGGTTGEGLWSGFWWSAVTMTTVGYGDKAPQTTGGRLVGLIWMFAAIIIISSFTAAITSVLTVSQLETGVSGVEDLDHVRVGTAGASSSAQFLDRERLRYVTYPSVAQAVEELASGGLDAVVYDAPILRHLVSTRGNPELYVLDEEFETQYYGIALPEGSALRDPLNLVILRLLDAPAWSDTVFRYLGG